MLDHTARTQAWLSNLAAMIAEIEASGVAAPRLRAKRTRKLKPLSEE